MTTAANASRPERLGLGGLLVALLAALLLLSGCAGGNGSDAGAGSNGRAGEPTGKQPRGTVLNPADPAPDFQLVDQHGQPFRLSDHRGQVVAIFFGYTYCPDVCPLTLGFIASASGGLGADADRVQFVFVSVDPERDSPERLNEYLGRVDAEIAGLTGTPEAVAAVAADYDILVQRRPRDDGGYFVDHSAHMTLVDPQGNLKVVLPMGSDGDDLLNDIRWLLRQQG